MAARRQTAHLSPRARAAEFIAQGLIAPHRPTSGPDTPTNQGEVYPQVPEGAGLLDWTRASHFNWHVREGNSRPRCVICRWPTWLLDEDGVPCHKICAEQEMIADARQWQAGQRSSPTSPAGDQATIR